MTPGVPDWRRQLVRPDPREMRARLRVLTLERGRAYPARWVDDQVLILSAWITELEREDRPS